LVEIGQGITNSILESILAPLLSAAPRVNRGRAQRRTT